MEEEIILGRDEASETFKQFLTQYDAPAYIRRARRVAAALEEIRRQCRRQRDEWLKMVRIQLGLLHALAGEWSNLREMVQDEAQLDILRDLHDQLSPRLRATIEATDSVRTLRRALQELCESLERFNERWRVFLPRVELIALNQLRDDYNRYYVLEKECAVRSARVARQGFLRLEPFAIDDLSAEFPLLPVPRGRD
jgi:predicted kinase